MSERHSPVMGLGSVSNLQWSWRAARRIRPDLKKERLYQNYFRRTLRWKCRPRKLN